jgi:hypothetical protein
MRLYTVEITREVVVLAHSREAAEMIAEDERHDIEGDCEPSFTAHVALALPYGWDDRSSPYHALARGDGRADWTIGQWRAFIAEVDDEAKRVAEFNAKQLAMPGVD